MNFRYVAVAIISVGIFCFGVILPNAQDLPIPDGKYGSKIRRAMNSFQAQLGIPTTEEIDEKTNLALMKEVQLFYGNTEPSAGNEEISSEASGIEDLSDFEEKVEKLRYTVIDDPELFLGRLQERVDPFRIHALSRPMFKTTLDAAIPFVGCASDNQRVLAFYNVFQHIWMFFWLDEEFNILDVRLSRGFSPKQLPRNTYWVDFLNEEKSAHSAIKRAFEIQSDVFGKLFSGEVCAQREKIEFIFTNERALDLMSSNASMMRAVPQSFLDGIQSETMQIENLEDPKDLILADVIKDSDANELMTLHTLRSSRIVSLVQVWDLNGKEPRYLNGGYSIFVEDR